MDRVFLHIGLPKTGTTYLQRILWENKDALGDEGLLLPGHGHREHLWAALEVQGRDVARRHERAPGTWQRLCAELAGSSGTGLLTHEFFCAASAEQARTAVAQLPTAHVEVIITARDTASLLAAGWQELVKNGSTLSPEQAADEDRHGEFSWDTWDLHGVLRRWAEAVPPDRLHVLPLPAASAAPDQLWRNFSGVLGLAGEYAVPSNAVNASLGAVQVQALRRINARLSAFKKTSVDRGTWIRGYLAEQKLAAQSSEKFALDESLVDDCRARSQRTVDLIEELGVHVVGDAASLLVPDQLPERRTLASVRDDEIVDSSARLVADLLEDIRRLTSSQTSPPDQGTGSSFTAGVRKRARALRSRRGDSGE